MFIRPLAWLLLVLLFTGCQTFSSNTDSTTLQAPLSGGGEWLREQDYFSASQNKLAAQNAWQLRAKVAVQTPQVKESANLVWNFRDQSNQLRMFGPLGAGAIRLEYDRFGVQLSDGKGILHRGNNAEQLLTKIVGWPIPVGALSYWLFGLPHPHYTYEYQLNEQAQISELRQLGWRVSYSAYSESAPQQWAAPLARKITAVKHLGEDQTAVVKVVTKSWQP